MGLIHVLDTEVSNKIAAGEVVEKPLSIVKELIENSIDAGASVITVEIRNGGISYIRVTDNGSGMSEEDAKICFLRHATSKIQTGSDLEAIYTLGFRGEALSSIGAVSKVRIYTKRRQDDTGVCVTCEGGEILSSADAGAPNGTVVEVSDLFYNTPARLKFLKKPATESGYISDIVSRYVLAHPEISFKLIRDGKENIFSSGDNKLINAVYSVYGRDFAKSMLDVDYEYNGIRVTGMIGKGTLSRANRNNETFFVNKRYIKSAIMIRALEEAYKNQIMISKFPTAILNIEIAAGDVDINVHPTKLECKFSNEQDIYQAVYHAAKSTLYAMPNVPEIENTPKVKKNDTQESPFKAEGGEQKTLEELYNEKLRNALKPSNDYKFKTEHRESPIPVVKSETEQNTVAEKHETTQRQEFRPAINPETEPVAEQRRKSDYSESKTAKAERAAESDMPIEDAQDEKFEKMLKRAMEAKDTVKVDSYVEPEKIEEIKPENRRQRVDTFAMIDYALEVGKKKSKYNKISDPSVGGGPEIEAEVTDWRTYRDKANEAYAKRMEENIFSESSFKVIGQLFDTYILVEKGDRMLMIDQHAAHERLNFEELKREIAESGIMSQMLMEPVEIRLNGEETAIFSEHKAEFNKMGFEAELNDSGDVIITAAPGDITWSDIEPLFIELLTQAGEMSNKLITYSQERLLYTISCKAAIKANMEISELEMRSLVEKVFKLKNINTCPHGRPIVIAMSKKEIEKSFKRIV